VLVAAKRKALHQGERTQRLRLPHYRWGSVPAVITDTLVQQSSCNACNKMEFGVISKAVGLSCFSLNLR